MGLTIGDLPFLGFVEVARNAAFAIKIPLVSRPFWGRADLPVQRFFEVARNASVAIKVPLVNRPFWG